MKRGSDVFLRDGSLMIAAAALSGPVRELLGDDEAARGETRFGLMTDLHYADKDPAGSRHYRETLTKLAEAGQQLSAEGISFAVELGDFIDAAASVDDERHYLTRINRDFSALSPHRHYVLGNHCVDTLTKEEFWGPSNKPARTTRSTRMATISSYWTLAFAVMGRRTAARTFSGPTPMSRRPNSSGCRPIWKLPPSQRSSSCTNGST